ncbi:MAG TPA: GNAT family N-acetyltransferase [Vitreimonas sp.]|jgi:RimJ/RimL family protein N-acetyltransferase|nr:GNAT family N-acetyltransferase [Vitreimonas sp.]
MRDVIEIETKRLKLRRVRMSDAPRIARFCNDPGVGRMLAQTPLPYLEAAAEGWIMTLDARRSLDQDFVFAAVLPGEGLIGVIGADQRTKGEYEIGYWFGRPYWGLGYGTEAVGAFVAEARRLGPLAAGHFVDNPASGRLLNKVGFEYTGEIKRMFSMGRGESVDSKRMRYRGAGLNGGKREAAFA